MFLISGLLQFILLSCLIPSGESTAGLTEDEKKQLLDGHNWYRNSLAGEDRAGREMAGFARDMRLLLWDADLAETAEEYAAQCNKAHGWVDSPASWREVKLQKLTNSAGQNLFFISGHDEFNVTSAVDAWYREIRFWSWTSKDCDPDDDSAVCGHLTQVLWADTEFLGCAKQHCADSVTGNPFTNVVCHYADAGNFVNQDPFETTQTLQPCFMPGYEHNCQYENLCSITQSDDQRQVICEDDFSSDNENLRMVMVHDQCNMDGSYVRFAFKNSPLACGLCSPMTVPNDCHDITPDGEDDTYCSLMTSFCGDNQALTYTNCPDTCGTCAEYETIQTDNQDRALREFGVAPTSRLYNDGDIWPGCLAADNTCPAGCNSEDAGRKDAANEIFSLTFSLICVCSVLVA